MSIKTICIIAATESRYLYMFDNKGNMITFTNLENTYDMPIEKVELMVAFIKRKGLSPNVIIDPETLEFFAYHDIDVHNL
jgi:exosome complex RNA-binding protein Rrp42 (RNase PH superfamily)